MPGLSPAGADLGLGDMLGQQVAGETEEQRKKRMAQQANGFEGSAAVESLLGPEANQMLRDRANRGVNAENIQANRNNDLRMRSLRGTLGLIKRSREAP